MTVPDEVVFLLDVDNTLLDNDHIVTDLSHHLAQEFGEENRDRYWAIFEALRKDLGYADSLEALQGYLPKSADRASAIVLAASRGVCSRKENG